ncbi:MAG: hypothetical protein H0U74_21690 [Bradymonadaceae bacterium]|nr:hypothetical protein [Lujinxingiaceae bacterium]
MESNSQPSVAAGRLRIQSPYPALQALLPRLSSLSPSKKRGPVFRQREEAEFFIRSLTDSVGQVLVPVWVIDHNDLQNSKILSWSITVDRC